MRLYDKPELLIAFRSSLRAAGISERSISHIDLLPFDQNHYYETRVLDLIVRELRLNRKQIDEKHSDRVIQTGSNLAGYARYLVGKYHLRV